MDTIRRGKFVFLFVAIPHAESCETNDFLNESVYKPGSSGESCQWILSDCWGGALHSLRASARAASSSESAREDRGQETKKLASSKHRKRRPRERSGDSFCLAYTGLRVDDITAVRT
jgi:hypothetical protein